MRELFVTELEEMKAKARDEGYQVGKSDAIKECKMLVGTYGVKDIDSEETKIYIRAREEAVEQLAKYEPDIGNWSWTNAYNEIQSLEERNARLTELLDEIVNKARYKYVPILATTKYKSTAGVEVKLHMVQIEKARKALEVKT